MKKSVVIGIIVIAVIVVVGVFLNVWNYNSGGGDNQAQSGEQNSMAVEIRGFAFSPTEVTINVRETITWTNYDSAKHTVTSDSGSELDSALLGKGDTYSHTFNTAGEYPYHCTPHPYMTGKIIVK